LREVVRPAVKGETWVLFLRQRNGKLVADAFYPVYGIPGLRKVGPAFVEGLVPFAK
jgi:hypothetical protein